MWRVIAALFAVRNTEWEEKKSKIVPHVFYDMCILLFAEYLWNQEHFKNNDARPKLTDSY